MHSNSQPRVVVITGASAGIGRAAAQAFARERAKIGLIARGVERLEATAREVEQLGGTALVLPADVADANAIESAATKAEAELGPIDVWVNNAMTSVFSAIKDTPAEEFRRVTEVTYLGYVHGTLAALRRMLTRDRGVIVQVSSALAYRGIPLQAAYCAAKHAIDGFCDSLRCELRHDHSHVHVTLVQLSAFNTPQFSWVKSRLPRKAQPLPPIFQPEIAADAIVWASHHPRRQYVVGGPALKAIIGNKLVPGLADRVLARKGYSGQQTDQWENAARPDNLWQPAPGKFGAHGEFDAKAKSRSLQWRLAKYRGRVAAAVALLLALGAGFIGVRH
jgi:NAD(P)-dependent dehydrogenase (short-subunit alcohol dehydrogenase family)